MSDTEQKSDDGGLFHSLQGNMDWSAEYGCTMRDWFAGQAMAALLGGGEFMQYAADVTSNGTEMKQLVAGNAYSQADAMLAERAKGAGE